jgi:hypothetical protein
MRLLKTAQAGGRLPLDDVALYGAQLHVVVSQTEIYRQGVTDLLTADGVSVTHIEWIAPTLEDVFISAVSN